MSFPVITPSRPLNQDWVSDWRELTPPGAMLIQGSPVGFGFSVQYLINNALGTGGTFSLEFSNFGDKAPNDKPIPASSFPSTPAISDIVLSAPGSSFTENHTVLYMPFLYYRIRYTKGGMTGGTFITGSSR
jgi:hypothetical protein